MNDEISAKLETKKKLIMPVNIRCEQPFYRAFYCAAPGLEKPAKDLRCVLCVECGVLGHRAVF